MSSIDLWQVYGSREDTDAVIIRNLVREKESAESRASSLEYDLKRIKDALEAAGYRIDTYRYSSEGIIKPPLRPAPKNPPRKQKVHKVVP